MIPTVQFAIGNVAEHVMPFSCMSHTIRSVLKSSQENRIVLIYFSPAADRVNYQ